jgi:hypothetical protein
MPGVSANRTWQRPTPPSAPRFTTKGFIIYLMWSIPTSRKEVFMDIIDSSRLVAIGLA